MTASPHVANEQRGEYADFVRRFDLHWREGRAGLDGLLSLLGPDIRLAAPGLRRTVGWAAARRAFEETFRVFPDLRGEVHAWAAQGDQLFIEMTFTATIGARRTSWHNVDRFTFRQGVAVERIAYFDRGRVLRAFLASPRGWLHLWKRMRADL